MWGYPAGPCLFIQLRAGQWKGHTSHPPAEPSTLLQHKRIAASAKNKKSSANRARNKALLAALKATHHLYAEEPSPALGPTPLWLQQQLWMIHPNKVLHTLGHRGCGCVQAGGHARWPCHGVAEPSSPYSALWGAEQSCFTLDIWHTTRASPLPIRLPTHLHPSPTQTPLAINKQLKCQPVPGKSPRQLHQIQWAWNSCLGQSWCREALSWTRAWPGIPPAPLWSSGQCLACVPKLLSASPQHQKPRCPHSTPHWHDLML